MDRIRGFFGKNVKEFNGVLLVLVCLFMVLISGFTSYALFTSETVSKEKIQMSVGATYYKLTAIQKEGGTITLTNETTKESSTDFVLAKKNDEVRVSVTPMAGYQLESLTYKGEEIANNSTIIMTAGKGDIEVVYSKIGYDITINQAVGGTVTLTNNTSKESSTSSLEASINDVITVETTVLPGYKLEAVYISSKKLTGNSFVMGTEEVIVTVEYSKIEYNITSVIDDEDKGTILITNETTNTSGDKVIGHVGDIIKIEALPIEGYHVTTITYNQEEIENGKTFTMPASDVEIEASYQANTYKIKYEYNGATSGNNEAEKEITYDSTYGTLATPSRIYNITYNLDGGTGDTEEDVNYVFDGWYLDNAYTHLITSTTKVTTAKNHNLYAKWTGGELTLPTPTKEGYTFAGWYEDALFTKKIGNGGDKYQVTYNIEMYAKWSQNSFEVTYDYATNGGNSADKENAVFIYGEKIDLGVKANKDGYSFVGWNTDKNAKEALTELTMGSQDITLYAIYKKDLKATFTVQDSNAVTASAQEAVCSIYNKETSCTAKAPTLTAKTGYTAIGWNTNKDATTSSLASGANLTLSSNSTYYSITKNNTNLTSTFTVQDTNAATTSASSVSCTRYNGATSCSIKAPTLTAKSGYTAIGWNTNKDATTSSLASGANLTLSSNSTYYSITKNNTNLTATFNANGATAIGQDSASCTRYNGASSCQVTLPTITRNGFTINGWSTNKDATSGTAAGAKVTLTGNATYYALSSKGVTLTFYRNNATSITPSGGSASTDDSLTQSCTIRNAATTCNITSPKITAPSNTPTVVGWNTNSTATTSAWDQNTAKAVNANASYYAITKKNAVTRKATFTIQDANAVTASATSASCTITATYNGQAQGTTCDITAPTLTAKSGYTSIGWNTNKNATTSSVASGAKITLSNNPTYYSITKNNTKLTATFNTNGATSIGENTASCERYNGATSCQVTLPTITRNGFTINGWSTNKDATSGTAAGEKVTLTGNATYYALSSKGVTLTFYRNNATSITPSGGSASTATSLTQSCTIRNSATTCNITSPKITAPSNTPTVLGWNTSASATTSAWTVNTAKAFSANASYYAITKKDAITRKATFTVQDPDAATASATSASCTIAATYNGQAQGTTCEITAPTLTAKSGYQVVGWNTNKDATTASVASGGKATLSSNPTYYSITKKPAKTYTLTLNANGGTGSADSLSCTIKEVYNGATQATSCQVTLPSNPFTYNGWTFNGYSTNKAATSGTAAGAKVTLTGNATYYALWKKPAKTITVNYSKGTGISAIGKTTDSCTIAAAYNGATQATSCNITLPSITASSGYTVSGWYEGSNKVGNANATVAVSANKNLEAKANTNSYQITYDANYYSNNLWSDTQNVSKYSSAGTAPKSKTYVSDNSVQKGQYLKFIMPSGTSGGPYYPTSSALTAGKTYTWSIYIKASSAKTLNIGSEQGGRTKVNVTTSWQKVTHTFTAQDTQYRAFVFYVSSGESSWADGDELYIHSLEIMEGTPDHDEQTKKYGEQLGTLPSPTRENYTFQGWYTAPVGGSKISSTTTVPSKDTTYYAHWTTNSYKVTYDYATNGGSSATVTSDDFYYGSNVDLSPTASKSGYSFVGWNTNKDATTALTSYNITGNTTLYAIYKQTLKATFNTNGATSVGSASLTCTRYNKGASCTVKAPSITRSGFTVNGWSTNKDATSGTAVGANLTLTGNTTYYALTSKGITITFNRNNAASITPSGGSASTETSLTQSCTIRNAATTCNVTSPKITAPSNTPTVVGWNTSANATTSAWSVNTAKAFSANATYYAITRKDAVTRTATFTVQDTNAATTSATSATCTIAATYNGKAQGTSCTAKAPTLTAKSGYTVIGWNTNKSATSSSVANGANVTLSSNPTYYSITKNNTNLKGTFTVQDSNAVTASATSVSCTRYNGASSCSIKAPTLTAKTGYTAIGWNTNKSATTSSLASGGSVSISSNQTYYSITKNNTNLTATFNANGATSVGSANASCTRYNGATSCQVTLPTITRSGFTINGWSTNKDATSGTAAGSKVSISANTTYYALSSKGVTVTFYRNGAASITPSGGSANTGTSLTQSCTIRNAATTCNITSPKITASSNTPTVTGWSTAAGTHSNQWSQNTAKAFSANASYYAQTTKAAVTRKATFTVQDSNAVTTSATSATCTIAATYNGTAQGTSCTAKAPTLTAKSGYTAIGWNTNKSATSSSVASGANVTLSSNPTYYSITKYNTNLTGTFTVQDSNAVTASATSVSCTKYNGATSCSIKAPTLTAKTGYTAIGWNTNKSATSSSLASGGSVSISSNQTYYSITKNNTNLTATFNANGATIGSTSASCTRYNGARSCQVTLPTITRSGFTINGWSTNKNATSGTAAGSKVSISANTTYYALSSKGVTITFYRNGAASITPSGGSANTGTSLTQSCTIRNAATTCNITSPKITASSNTPTVTGWSTAAGTHSNQWSHNTAKAFSANASYYAQTTKAAVTRKATFTVQDSKAVTSSATSATCTIAATYNGTAQGTSCSTKAPTLTAKSGYTAIGWNTSKTATTSSLASGASITLSSNPTYYSITKHNTNLTATFNKNGATSIGSTSASCTRYNGATSCQVTLPTITRSGFTINGWSTSSSATSGTAAGSKVSISANTTYYALTSKGVTVTFYRNNATNITPSGGSASTATSLTQSCTIRNSATTCNITSPKITAPSNTPTVLGWNTSASATSSAWSQNTAKAFSANASYYAITRKDAKTITITFNKNNASSISATSKQCTIAATYNGTAQATSCNVTSPTITAPSNTPRVLGWNTSASATSSAWSVNTAKAVSANATYYAITRKDAKTITITFNKNNASAIGATSKSCTIAATYNGKAQGTTCSVTSPTITAPSATPTVVGWNTSASATTSSWGANAAKSVSANATYYAITRKDAKTITITFNKNNASAIGATSKSCTIAATYNGKAQGTTCSVTSPTITAPSATPTVVGWNTSASATTSSWGANTAKSVSANATYYAITRKDARTITIKYSKGTGINTIAATSNSCNIAATYNGKAQASSCQVTLPTISGLTGYTVAGWYNSSNSKVGNASAKVSVSANATYTAKANPNTRTVTFKTSDGASTYGSCTYTYDPNGGETAKPTTFFGTGCSVTQPTKSGYTLAGWSMTANGTTTNYGANSGVGNAWVNEDPGGNLTLYAIFKKTVTITFNKNGASAIGATTKSCTMYNSATSCSITSPTITPATYFSTVGWNTNKNGTTSSWNANTAKSVSANATYYAITKQTSGQQTFTATFKKISEVITTTTYASACSGGKCSSAPTLNFGGLNSPSFTSKSCTTALGYNGNRPTSCSVALPTVSNTNITTGSDWKDVINPYTGGAYSASNNRLMTYYNNKTTTNYYTFKGWNTSSTASSGSTGSATISKNTTFYPIVTYKQYKVFIKDPYWVYFPTSTESWTINGSTYYTYEKGYKLGASLGGYSAAGYSSYAAKYHDTATGTRTETATIYLPMVYYNSGDAISSKGTHYFTKAFSTSNGAITNVLCRRAATVGSLWTGSGFVTTSERELQKYDYLTIIADTNYTINQIDGTQGMSSQRALVKSNTRNTNGINITNRNVYSFVAKMYIMPATMTRYDYLTGVSSFRCYDGSTLYQRNDSTTGETNYFKV